MICSPLIRNAEEVSGPDEFNNSILNIKAARNLKITKKSTKWEKTVDRIIRQENGADYNVLCNGVLKDESGSAWFGKEIHFSIECPNEMLGELLVNFHDWNNQDISGIIEFEGRKVKFGELTGDGKWIKLHVMREDSNDGMLILKENSNLMITQLVLTK